MIDASAPGYGERRQLRDRVIEPEGETIPLETRPNHPAHMHESKRLNERVGEPDSQRPSPQTTSNEFTVGSGRRKKGPRRRIVELARESSSTNQQTRGEFPQDSTRQAPASIGIEDMSPRCNPTLVTPLRDRSDMSSPLEQTREILDSTGLSRPDVSEKVRSLVSEIQSLNVNVNGEAYRQKIESLKSEVGSNWLSVLSEEGWNQDHIKLENPLFRASSQGILSGSRTLG